MIHDLSFPTKGHSVNDGIPKQYCAVQYEVFDYITPLIQSVGRGIWIGKADRIAFAYSPNFPR